MVNLMGHALGTTWGATVVIAYECPLRMTGMVRSANGSRSENTCPCSALSGLRPPLRLPQRGLHCQLTIKIPAQPWDFLQAYATHTTHPSSRLTLLPLVLQTSL